MLPAALEGDCEDRHVSGAQPGIFESCTIEGLVDCCGSIKLVAQRNLSGLAQGHAHLRIGGFVVDEQDLLAIRALEQVVVQVAVRTGISVTIALVSAGAIAVWPRRFFSSATVWNASFFVRSMRVMPRKWFFQRQ